ncbi:YhcN/YlaJ family sporulation lipoprotein [Texcoconibacillus texcoconensis]|uniref:Uncharacterized protein n=1 Tax=Texcoconibacillus texcoconensis TaxID=1095777 RepID=A0A840QPG6_9BACI|nr:YhcN/YlaJ family sporulation lipoprotein [Texcoconibacillus texcoconensis]MBB5173217.1 hypothetical protein [Texcoconibacillus texcoconensis]
MKKTVLTLTAVTVLTTGGMAGCGDVDEGARGPYQGQTENYMDPDRYDNGYLGARNDASDQYGTYQRPRRETVGDRNQRDFDRGLGGTRFGGQRNDGNQRGFGITGNDRDGMADDNGIVNNRGITGQHNRDDDLTGTRDRDQVDRKDQEGTRSQNFNRSEYDGNTTKRVQNRVADIDGVDESHVIVNGDDVIVAVEDGEDVEDEVREQVNKMDDDKNVHVVTDRDQVGQVRDIDEQIQAGEPFEEFGATFNEMLDDLGDAAQRPFERSR